MILDSTDGSPLRLVEPGEAMLPADVPGVLRGEGIFESFLVEDGEASPFLPEHGRRLQESALKLGFDLQGQGLVQAFHRIQSQFPKGIWRLRYTVLRGRGDALLRFWVAGRPAPPPDQVDLALSPFRRDPLDPLVSAKTVSRAGSQQARRLAESQGAWEALMPTIDGDLAESTSCNLFVLEKGVLATPAPDRGILLGVTRGALLRACRRAALPALERRLEIQNLLDADEIYLTNAVIGVIPIRRILGLRDDLPGASGPFLPRLRQAYLEECRRARVSRAQTLPNPMSAS